MQNPKVEKNLIRKLPARLAPALVLILGLILVSMPASAQQASSSSDVPVHMVVTAKPHHGDHVPALAADDVKVFQGNKQDQVTSWVSLQGDHAGLQLFILIDDIARDSLSLQFNTIKNFIDEQPPTTAIGVGYMRNGTVFVAQAPTADHSLAERALRLPMGGAVGYSSPYLAVSDLMKKWPVTQDRREILMITSGVDPLGGGFSEDPYTYPYLEEAFDRAQRGGFIVYAIYVPTVGRAGRGFFRTDMAQDGLDLLAQKTGGQAYNLLYGTPVDITAYLQDISFNLKHQYALTFLAGRVNKPTLQPVKIKTEMPNMRLITSEEGYVGNGM
jgi:hypothetical protein